MGKTTKKHPFAALFIAFVLLMTSCVPGGAGDGKRRSSSNQNTEGASGSGSGGNVNGGDNSAGQQDGTVGSNNNNLATGRAEVRHIVDPFDGTYKTKVTIPKNFTGLLYLAGLNITSLNNRLVSVRFNFGRNMEPVVVPATIGRAPGIIPQTDIEVLILDMEDRPFENIRLLYDLYDYNDYRDSGGLETKDPITDPRDGNLFCRGLNLEHDPTFIGSSSNAACDQAGERCLYAYAKVEDSLLATQDASLNKIAGLPTEPQIALSSGGSYSNDSIADNLKKCLPDNYDAPSAGDLGAILGLNIPALGFDTQIIANNITYFYRGPYRPLAFSDWEISGSALYSDSNAGGSAVAPTGIFQKKFVSNGNALEEAESGMRSFLFPRAGKLDLQANINYFGSTVSFPSNATAPTTTRTIDSLLAAGQSNFVDGCNIRMVNADPFSGEGISSCNVTATIELITVDPVSGQEELIDQTTTSRVKLQLIRPSVTNFQGQEVLYTSLKTCSNSNACGSSECCFNSRCWSKDLVTQCLEDVDVIGNRSIGQVCSSDYECNSLCCNQSTGRCSVHVNDQTDTVLCSKIPGQSCVSKEFCRQENINTCKVVKTGVNIQGQVTCALRCRPIPTFGDCINGTCTPPPNPTVPQFDSNNPDCSEAIDPEDF